jgi:predicted permease
MTDWRFALRRLLRSPLFTLFGILTLALGIGTTTGIYSVVRAVVGPPSGVRDADRLLNVYNAFGGNPAFSGFSWPDYQDLRAHQTVFEEMTAWSYFGAAYSANGQLGTSFGEIVGGEYFTVLGVKPARGRLLQPADDRKGSVPVAVISHGMWQRIYGGAEGAVGSTMKVNGHTFEVIGVAPPEFHGLFNNGIVPTTVWVPIASAGDVYHRSSGAVFDVSDRQTRFLFAKGVLKPDRTVDEARAELTVLAKQLNAAYPIGGDALLAGKSLSDKNRPWTARRMVDVRVNESATDLVGGLMAVLMVSVGIVLLVACTNLANLTLARGSGRQQELAVRLALGASRWKLVRESLAESLILATAGGLVGLAVARVLIRLLSGELAVSGSSAVLQLDPHLDLDVLLVAACATGVTLIVAGLGPALQSTRATVRSTLVADGAPMTTLRWRGRRYLIAAQVGVSSTLLALAAVAVMQLRSIQQQNPGFMLDQLAIAAIDFEVQGYDDAKIQRIVESFVGQLSSSPDALGATVVSGLPVGATSSRRGSVTGGDAKPRFATIIGAGPNFVAILGMSLTQGRAWDARDSREAHVTVIDEWTAKTLFGTVDVLGRTIGVREGDLPVEAETVIGVLANPGVLSGSATVYLPFKGDYGKRVVLVARARHDPQDLASVVRETLRRIDGDLVARTGTGPAVVGSNSQFFEITAAAASLLGGFAWVLALVGLYGVLTHLVLRRTREIGIRVALGASRRNIITMILAQGLRPVAFGLVAGLVCGALVRMALETQFVLSGPALDLLLLVACPLLFVATAILACYLPARRAARVDPNTALRQT